MDSNRSRPYSALLALVIGVVSTVLISSTAATVYVASGATRLGRGDAEPAITLFPSTAHRQGRAAAELLDSLIAPLGDLAPMDSVTLRNALALLRTGKNQQGLIAYDTAAGATLDTLRFLRQWARSEALPAYWGTLPGFVGIEAASALPMHAYYPLRRFMMLNEASADSALLAGDAAAAMVHARETLAAARHLVAQSSMIDLLMGRVLIQRGARLLVRSAQQGDDPLTAGAARRLDAMATGAFTVDRHQLHAYRSLGESPADGRLLAVAADTRLHDALRMAAFEGLLSGACLRPREVLFGLTAERRMAFQQLAQAVEDIPRARDLVTLEEKDFDNFDNGVAWRALGRGKSPRAGSPLAWIVPSSVSDRVNWCRRMSVS